MLKASRVGTAPGTSTLWFPTPPADSFRGLGVISESEWWQTGQPRTVYHRPFAGASSGNATGAILWSGLFSLLRFAGAGGGAYLGAKRSRDKASGAAVGAILGLAGANIMAWVIASAIVAANTSGEVVVK